MNIDDCLKSGVLAAASCMLFTPAQADTFEIRIGAGHPASAAWIASIGKLMMPQISERVAAETGHEIHWTEAWGGSVCKLGECLEAVESGLLDMGEVQTVFEPSALLAWNFTYFVPFGEGDPSVAGRAAGQVYEDVPGLKEQLEGRYNQKFIGSGTVGDYGLITNFTWDEPSELDGIKIAAAGANIPWVTAVGVVPVQANLNEAFAAMQTGVYDGWVMFPDGVTSFRLHEVSKQFTVTGFGAIATPLVTINLDTWNSLPPEVQAIFSEEGRAWNGRMSDMIAEHQKMALQEMQDKGIRVLVLTEEQRKEWAALLPNIPAERTAEIAKAGQPADAVYDYVDRLSEAGTVFARDWLAER